MTLDVMQRDDCNIAQATEQWGTLMKSDVIQSNERARTSVEARAAVVLQSGSFFAANMLDPRYLGKNLSEEQRQAGHKFLLDEAGIRFPAKVGVVTAALTNLLADGLPAKYAQDSLPGGGTPPAMLAGVALVQKFRPGTLLCLPPSTRPPWGRSCKQCCQWALQQDVTCLHPYHPSVRPSAYWRGASPLGLFPSELTKLAQLLLNSFCAFCCLTLCPLPSSPHPVDHYAPPKPTQPSPAYQFGLQSYPPPILPIWASIIPPPPLTLCQLSQEASLSPAFIVAPN